MPSSCALSASLEWVGTACFISGGAIFTLQQVGAILCTLPLPVEASEPHLSLFSFKLFSPQRVTSLHSPSASFQSTSIFWRGMFTHIWCPDFTSGDSSFGNAMQDTPLDCSALEARQACVPGSHRTVNNPRDSS